eukprot:gene9842-10001_t
MLAAQQAIRQYGGVVTAMRVDVQHLKRFFQGNRAGIYKGADPGQPAKLEGHAVFVIGYNNDQQWWLVKNSYGVGFADGGFMRIAYDACDIMPSGRIFIVGWVPNNPAQLPRLCVTPDPGNSKCYRYTAKPTDFLTRVAQASGIRLSRLLQDNVDIVKDMGQPLKGLTVRLCNPALNLVNTVSSVKQQPAPAGKTWLLFSGRGFSYDAAEDGCRQLGGHLVTVDSLAKTKLLVQEFLDNSAVKFDGSQVWIGLKAKDGRPTTDKRQFLWLGNDQPANDSKLGDENAAKWGSADYQNWSYYFTAGSSGRQRVDNPDNYANQQAVCVAATAAGNPLLQPVGSWDDTSCLSPLPFVCERPSMGRAALAPAKIQMSKARLTATRIQAPDGKTWLFFNTLGFPRDDAQAVCVKLGGHLVMLTSRDKSQLLVREVLDNKEVSLMAPGVWIGLTSSDGQPTARRSGFRWSSGGSGKSASGNASPSFQDWSTFVAGNGRVLNQPDNTDGREGVCVTAVGSGGCCNPIGAWNDEPCSAEFPFICETTASTTQGSIVINL